ncbi:NAD(P)/FAD-dependent oxidoreductase [Chloroflexota bacterium]
MDIIYDAIIIGAGPAGLTAGLYTSRAKLRTLILEKGTLGGELMNRDWIENYPGFLEGVDGSELGSSMIGQVMSYGTEIQLNEVMNVIIDGNDKLVNTPQGQYRSKAIIIAGGAHQRKLGIPGEEEFVDKGVFYCATCDGPRFADKVVVVAGGGNSGITEALFLSRLVSKVILVELLPYLTATKILQERVFSNPNIDIKCGFKIEAIVGDEQVNSLELLDMKTRQRDFLKTDGILVHVGIEPNTDCLKGSLSLDERGQIIVNYNMETETTGVFAAGDIRHNSPMQIATAVGDGAIAALSLERYIGSLLT